jgi:hypothetical protein
MAILRSDIERALDELASQEEGMRFQGLAVVLGKIRWPELIARPRKKDDGLDAYAPANLTPEKVGKGLAASITPTLKKIFGDAKTAKEKFPDLKMLLFVTSAKVGNAARKQWEDAIQKDHGLELYIIEREEIIIQMMIPENAALGASFLYLHIDAEPQVADLIERTRRVSDAVTQNWAAKTKGYPLIELSAVELDANGAETDGLLTLEQTDQALSLGRRIVLEGPAGRGKTTTLIQLAQRTRTVGIPFIVELPAWTSSRRGILDFIAGMPASQTERLTAADLARVLQTQPFVLLLNGWNEIAEATSAEATNALRELERDFPSVGIIVATRTHHLTPPLPGALRLRLMPLQPTQRATYITERLGTKGDELRTRIEADSSLDELTRTPFILSEVTSLFEAQAAIPSTKVAILAEVIRLEEQREEHKNALEVLPLFSQQSDYLTVLATEMTRRGAVELLQADARMVVAGVTRGLVDRGQIEQVSAPTVLATLTAHHVLERVDYPQAAFRFELQEYFAALYIRAQLLDLQDDDHKATDRFIADYVNEPAWAEPLRMIAKTFAEQTGDVKADLQNTRVGAKLVHMALAVDLIFAGELAQLCGTAVWSQIGADVGARFRAVYAIHDNNFQQYALTAMLATGADDFSDVIVPLLSGEDEQTRLHTYRLWPNISSSSLGSNWREQVRGWREEARANFVSESLYHRFNGEIAAFAAEDKSIAVKKAAVSAFMWSARDDALIRVLESMDAQTFEEVALTNSLRIPEVLKPKTVAALRKSMETITDSQARLGIVLNLVDLGETGLDGVVKDMMTSLPAGDLRTMSSHDIQTALRYLHQTDPTWTSEWVAKQTAEGPLYWREFYVPFATAILDHLIEGYLQRLETESFKKMRIEGMIAVIAAGADANLAAHVFTKVRELRRKADAKNGQQDEFEWQVMNQLEDVFRGLPDDIAVAGIMASVTSGDPLDIKVASNLLSRVASPSVELLRIADTALTERLRAYLKSSVDLVLCQDDFDGEIKADLASVIAQVGKPEDMVDLVRLIHADIDRGRRGRAAWVAGDRGPLGNGGIMSYAMWHIAAVMHLDPIGAEQVLIDLLPEREYVRDVAAAMARDFVPKSERSSNRTLHYDLIWAARQGHTPPNDQRRMRFASALNAEIIRLLKQSEDGKPAAGLVELAKALAAIDGGSSAGTVLDVIDMPGQRDEYARLDAIERLLMAGAALPSTTLFALVDSILERTERWMQDSDRYLLYRCLALCPFVEDPTEGIGKVRDVVVKRRLGGHELRELITALGESRSDAAVDLLYEIAGDVPTFKQYEDNFINAFTRLDTSRAHELLLSFIDPDIHSMTLTHRPYRSDSLVVRLAELARRSSKVAARLLELCKRDLPELNRHGLSFVIAQLGTPEAVAANLVLIDDGKEPPIPQGVRDQLESAFVEQRSYGYGSNTFTEHARASNEVRVRLFKMVLEDEKRQKSAFKLLGQIEYWRLEHGRPTGEPRHPDIASGISWPPNEP